MHGLHVSSGGRYPVLRALAILQLASALFVGLGGIIASIYAAGAGPGRALPFGDKIIIALAGLAVTFFFMIFTLAFAELIKLLIDIEHNTRMASTNPSGEARLTATASNARGTRGEMLDGEETAEGALLRGH